MSLPFLDADSDLYLNLGIVLIITSILSRTKRGKLILNNGRMHIFMHLVKNPVALNGVLNMLGNDSLLLSPEDSFSINTISPNFDTLFDRDSMRVLIAVLISKELISVEYKKNDGFLYILSESGLEISSQLRSGIFDDIWIYCEQMLPLQRVTEQQLNAYLNKVLRREY